MHRDGNNIVFNYLEQRAFDVPPRAAVSSALETASVFLEIAEGTIQARIDSLAGSSLRNDQKKRERLLTRATDLTMFATNIVALCVPEVAAQVSEDLDFPVDPDATV